MGSPAIRSLLQIYPQALKSEHQGFASRRIEALTREKKKLKKGESSSFIDSQIKEAKSELASRLASANKTYELKLDTAKKLYDKEIQHQKDKFDGIKDAINDDWRKWVVANENYIKSLEQGGSGSYLPNLEADGSTYYHSQPSPTYGHTYPQDHADKYPVGEPWVLEPYVDSTEQFTNYGYVTNLPSAPPP